MNVYKTLNSIISS